MKRKRESFIEENSFKGDFLNLLTFRPLYRGKTHRQEIEQASAIHQSIIERLEHIADYAQLPERLAYQFSDKPHQVLHEMMSRLDEIDPEFRKRYE